jgi:hypothetical protein
MSRETPVLSHKHPSMVGPCGCRSSPLWYWGPVVIGVAQSMACVARQRLGALSQRSTLPLVSAVCPRRGQGVCAFLFLSSTCVRGWSMAIPHPTPPQRVGILRQLPVVFMLGPHEWCSFCFVCCRDRLSCLGQRLGDGGGRWADNTTNVVSCPSHPPPQTHFPHCVPLCPYHPPSPAAGAS